MRAQVVEVLAVMLSSVLTSCGPRVIQVSRVVTPPCSTSPPALPVSVISADESRVGAITEVVFKDARGCEYRIYRDHTVTIHENGTWDPGCLYMNARPDESGARLEPHSPLGKGILAALQDWLKPSGSEGINTADFQAPYVRDIVEGLESGLCTSGEGAN